MSPRSPLLWGWWARHVAPALLHARLLRERTLLLPPVSNKKSRGKRATLFPLLKSRVIASGLALTLTLGPWGQFLPVAASPAATITVTSNTGILENNLCSLAEAIINANNNLPTHDDCAAGTNPSDTIVMPANATFTYSTNVSGVGDSTLPAVTSPITISGQNSLLVRAVGSPAFRFLQINSTGNLTLNNMTLRNGSLTGGNSGGAILNGGGATLSLNNVTLTSNTGVNGGGGLSTAGTATIGNSTFSNNSATSGGGLTSTGTTTITNSTFQANTVNSLGGAIQVLGGTTAVTNSTLSGNRAGIGGAIHNQSATTTVTASTLATNTVTLNGGGVYNLSGTLSLINSTISGNRASYVGGGMAIVNNRLIITHSTVTGNSAILGGGALFTNDSTANTLELRNSLISGNNSNAAAEIFRGLPATTVINNGGNLLGDNSHYTAQAFIDFTPAATDRTGLSDGTHPTPLGNIRLPLGNNGGPTQTHGLPQFSPAVDIIGTGPLATDQRGLPRPVDADNVRPTGPDAPQSINDYDAGATEKQTPLAVTLALFEAEPRDNHILISWETTQESDNAGFNLYRATDPAAPGELLNAELIPSQSPGGGGAFYSFPDAEIQQGTTYFYWLESIDTGGNPERYGPVSATATIPTALSLTAFDTNSANLYQTQAWWAVLLAGVAALLGWRRNRRK